MNRRSAVPVGLVHEFINAVMYRAPEGQQEGSREQAQRFSAKRSPRDGGERPSRTPKGRKEYHFGSARPGVRSFACLIRGLRFAYPRLLSPRPSGAKIRVHTYEIVYSGLATILYFLAAASFAWAQPNLVPYQPQDWSDKLVISTIKGTNTSSSTFLSTDGFFVDFAVINAGSSSTITAFSVSIFLDGNLPGWIRLPQTSAYYAGASNGTGPDYPENAQKMAEDAVIAARNLGLDFGPCDADCNGNVDALFVMHSGQGYEVSGNSSDIASHEWQTVVRVSTGSNNRLGLPVYVSSYSTEPEYVWRSGDGTIGILLIWHIDQDQPSNDSEWYPGCTVCSGHYWVALIQADNKWHLEKNINEGDQGDPYPGICSGGIPCGTAFTAGTNPNSKLYSGKPSGVSITDIGTSGPLVTATRRLADRRCRAV